MDWGYNNWGIQDKAKELVGKVKELESLGFLINKQQQAELTKLKQELDELRAKCHHSWQTVQLFTHYRQYCYDCNVENHAYDHWKATSKS